MKTPNVQIVLRSIEKKSLPLKKKVSDLEVKTQADFDRAGELMKELKSYTKLAKSEEAKIVDPLKQALKATQSHFKPFYDSIELIELDTKLKMSSFVQANERKQLEVKKSFEAGDIKKMSTYIKKNEELEVKSENASVRKLKTLVITKESLIPREYLVPDEAKIKAALLAGEKIPGCKIELVNSIAI